MKVALGQFAVSKRWEDNLSQCLDLMARAHAGGADLLVLPEGVLARDITDPDIVLRSAQPLDGPFVTHLQEASRGTDLTTVMCVHSRANNSAINSAINSAQKERAWNTLIALRHGDVVAQYRKLHLYDAFSFKESDTVAPGDAVPPLLEVAGLQVGLMTCYDLRFPEMARRLAVDGADVLVLPAAWVRGPLKEMHWNVLTTARALENTAYLVATGECGPRNIGCSVVVDPLGVAIARAGEAPTLLFAELDPARLAQARQALPVLQNRRFARPELQATRPS